MPLGVPGRGPGEPVSQLPAQPLAPAAPVPHCHKRALVARCGSSGWRLPPALNLPEGPGCAGGCGCPRLCGVCRPHMQAAPNWRAEGLGPKKPLGVGRLSFL